MIIPLGHDKAIYRHPWVTFGIIALTCTTFVISLLLLPDDEQLETLDLEEQQLVSALWQSHGKTWVQRHRPELKTWPPEKLQYVPTSFRSIRIAFITDFKNGRVVPKNHPDYLDWIAFNEKQNKTLGVFRFVYRAGDWSYTLVTYALLHGGFLHLLGNMFFLLLCGCNIEDRWGRRLWLSLYVSGAAISAISYGFMHHWNPSHAAIGASGAVSAAMGAFLITHYNARLRLLYVLWYGHIFVGTFSIRAYIALPIWFIEQIAMMWFEGDFVQVGYSAHAGGFLFGVLLATILKISGIDKKLAAQSEQEATIILQPQPYLDGVAARERGDEQAAQRQFESLLKNHPHHGAGAYELFMIAVRQRNTQLIAHTASRATTNMKREGDFSALKQIWIDVNRADAAHMLDDRTLAALAHAHTADDPREALVIYRVLIEQKKDSVLHPKALLEAALLHMEFHEQDDAQALFKQVLALYPETAFAERAETLIHEFGLQPEL